MASIYSLDEVQAQGQPTPTTEVGGFSPYTITSPDTFSFVDITKDQGVAQGYLHGDSLVMIEGFDIHSTTAHRYIFSLVPGSMSTAPLRAEANHGSSPLMGVQRAPTSPHAVERSALTSGTRRSVP